jgi:peroxiredoxin
MGEPAPWFRAKALSGSERYAFDTVAGRHILMLFFGTAGREDCAAAIGIVARRRSLFDDERASFYGVTVDPADEANQRIEQLIPGIRWFLDYDKAVSRIFGAVDPAQEGFYRPHWLLLDPMLRVIGLFPLAQGEAAIAALEEASAAPRSPDWAPVLMAPHILEPALCRALIDHYLRDGGEESGFMREVGGKTILLTDPDHKMRRDCLIEEGELQDALKVRVRTRLTPLVERAFQFKATRMERYMVGCYTANAGHFRPHRDNTTRGTAHRRFAVTINLNAGDYDGGDLRFPEFGDRTYRPPTGGAVVFSCSLLHEATPVTSGTRYAFLPFLYDDDAAELREKNSRYLEEGLDGYRKDGTIQEG